MSDTKFRFLPYLSICGYFIRAIQSARPHFTCTMAPARRAFTSIAIMSSGAVLLAMILLLALQTRLVDGAVRKVRIPDKLDDVVDDEEDEEWKAWGTPKPKPRPAYDPPPDYYDGMDMSTFKTEFLKRNVGPTMGFAKLRIDVPREREEAPRIASKWTTLLKTGTIDAKVVAVDRSTIMITLPEGEDVLEVKDFVLSQPEAYEFKLGDNTFRRPGDPPLAVVAERLRKEKEMQDKSSKHSKDEL